MICDKMDFKFFCEEILGVSLVEKQYELMKQLIYNSKCIKVWYQR
jgi:hypothetical protein